MPRTLGRARYTRRSGPNGAIMDSHPEDVNRRMSTVPQEPFGEGTASRDTPQDMRTHAFSGPPGHSE